MGSTFRLSGEYLPLYIEQKVAGQVILEAPRNRQALQNTINKQVDSLFVKAVREPSKLCNFVLLSFHAGRGPVLLKAITKRVAKVRKMILKCSIMIPGALPESCQRWRGRLLECFVQLTSGLVPIKGGLLANPDAPPVRNTEDINRLNRIWLNSSGEEFSEGRIQCTCDPQIDRKHW